MDKSTLRMVCHRQETDGEITRFYCQAPPDFVMFNGHFPGMPILPGVAQLGLAVEAITKLTAAPSIARFEKMKFHNLIVPDTKFIMELTPLIAAWGYRIFDEKQEYASGKIVLR